MAREKKIALAAINITIAPHSPKRYIELFWDAFSETKSIPVWGSQHMFLATLGSLDSSSELSPLYGEIARFTHIDSDSEWYNIETKSIATEKELKQVVIPENLRPNYTGYKFIFYPESHLLVFDTINPKQDLNPKHVRNFLAGLFGIPRLYDKYGSVSLTVVPERNAVESILNIHTLRNLEIVLLRPNPDDLAQAEENFKRRMENLKVSRIASKYSAIPEESIVPDEDTKTLARVAATNGYVLGTGRDENDRPVRESTREKPKFLIEYFDPSKIDYWDFFRKLAELMRIEVELMRRDAPRGS